MVGNWSRVDQSWHSIDLLPRKMPPAIVFANADQSKHWFIEAPTDAVDSEEGDAAAFFAFVVVEEGGE